MKFQFSLHCDDCNLGIPARIKSQSALTHLLTTSRPRGTFSRLSTTQGCISRIELLQFPVVRSFWTSLGKSLFWKERLIIALGQTNFRGALQVVKTDFNNFQVIDFAISNPWVVYKLLKVV